MADFATLAFPTSGPQDNRFPHRALNSAFGALNATISRSTLVQTCATVRKMNHRTGVVATGVLTVNDLLP